MRNCVHFNFRKMAKECLDIKGMDQLQNIKHGDNGGGVYLSSACRVKLFKEQKLVCVVSKTMPLSKQKADS